MQKGAALITGAARRIGAEIARTLAADGYPVVIHCNGSVDDAASVAEQIAEQGGRAAIVSGDLADHDRVMQLIPEASEAIGAPLSVLVNNASLFQNDSIRTADLQSFDSHMAVNLRAPLFLTQGFASALPDGLPGNVINLVDMRVRKLLPGFTSYTLAKAALETLTTTTAMALAPRIRVNAIGPGPVLANERQSEVQFQRQWSSTLLQRGAHPDEIASCVRYILSAPALTGQMIMLDGGQHLSWPPLGPDSPELDD